MQFPRTSAEQQASKASRARRMALYEEVQRRRANQNIKQIAEQMGLSRGTVRIYYYAEAFPERGQHKRNPNKLDPFLPYLERRYREFGAMARQRVKSIGLRC